MVSKSAKLVQGIMQISVARQWLLPAISCATISHLLVQGMWETHSPLLQLPFITPEITKHCVTGKRAIRSIADLLDMNDSERRNLLRTLNDEQYEETISIAQTFPTARVDAVNFRILGQENITPSGLITCQVRLSLEYPSVGSNDVTDDKGKENEVTKLEEEVQTFEFDEDGNLLDEPGRKVGKTLTAARPIYCPYFPNVKRPNWWVTLVNKNHTNFVATPVKIFDLADSKTVTLQFPAPPKPMSVSMLLVVKSDAVVGTDIVKEVKFNVVPQQDHSPSERWDISGDENDQTVPFADDE